MNQTEWYAQHFAGRHLSEPQAGCGICACLVAGRDLTTILLPAYAALIATEDRSW